MTNDYDYQLEKILRAIVRDYDLPDQTGSPRDVAQNLMIKHGLLTLLADKQGHDEKSLLEALRQCARRYGRLYDYLVLHLYSTHTGVPMEVGYYQADDFLVMVFKAPVAPVLEAMGRFVMPFVRRHYHQPAPKPEQMRALAYRTLDFMFAADDRTLLDGVVQHMQPMFTMPLRPLPGIELSDGLPDAPPPITPSPGGDDETQPAQAEDSGPQTDEPPDREVRSGRRGTGPLRAPLPYWDLKDED